MMRLTLHAADADDRTLALGALHMELPQAVAAGEPSDDQLVTVLPAPGPVGACPRPWVWTRC